MGSSCEHQGPILKDPLMVGSKMICLGCGLDQQEWAVKLDQGVNPMRL